MNTSVKKFVKAIFLLPGAISIILSACSGDSPVNKSPNSLDNAGLKGKVKSLTEKEYYALNKSGEVQKGEIKGKRISRFNYNGNRIEISLFGSQGGQYSRITSQYDENENLVEMIRYMGDLVDSKETFRYDEKGFETGGERYSSDEILVSKHTCRYDERGNRIETTHLDANGNSETKYLSKFDEKGNKTETDVFKNGNLASKYTFRYNENGRLVETNTLLMESGYEMIENYKYDDEGRISEQSTIIQGKGGKSVFRYDKIDMYGNWLVRIEAGNDTTITEREIKYYK